jgi:seryl-tRNA synthetase
MVRTSFTAAVPLQSVRDTLTTQLRFYFPQITALEFDEAEVVVLSEDPLDEQKLARAADRILERFSAIPRGLRTRTLLDADDPDSVQAWLSRPVRFPTDVLAQAVAHLTDDLRRVAVRRGRRLVPGRAVAERLGTNLYGHETAALLGALDRFANRSIAEAYDAEELLIPSMIPSWIVDRCGYFETGCQHLSFVAPVSNDPDVFDGFLPFWKASDAGSDRTADRRLLEYLKAPRDLLNPAACLHCYRLLENQTVGADEALVMTVGGSVFRDESGNLNNQERLYEFRMREGVVIGGAEPVSRLHGQLLDLLALTGLLLGLRFALETASDMFFNDGAGTQLFAQLVSDSKIELAARSASLDRRVASASLNKHGSHFSEPFGIRDERGLPASTMCIGFGIDRLAFLLDERYGTDLSALADDIDANARRIVKERS